MAVGKQALRNNTTASNNTAVGYQAGYSNTTGVYLTAIGTQAGYGNTTANYNVMIGRKTGFATTTGAYNAFVGTEAGVANTTGANNTALGTFALGSNTTASNNTAVGYQAMVANTTGHGNAAFGRLTLDANTTGVQNTALGESALGANTTANYNVAVGSAALGSNTTGSNNVAVGYSAGSVATGANNTFIGSSAGEAATTGTENTFVGNVAGSAITTGAKNTILGRYNGNQGGLDIRTTSNYIVLSDGDGNPRGWFTDSGNFLVGTTAYNLADGNILQANGEVFSTIANSLNTLHVYDITNSAFRFYVSGGGQIHATSTSITAISDQSLKENIRDLDKGLDSILALQPRRFDWKNGDGNDIMGFIAQEVEEVMPELVHDTKYKDEETKRGLKMGDMIPSLVKAIQEQNEIITDLRARIAALESN